MIANATWPSVATAFLLCCSIPLSNDINICSSAFIPLEQDDNIYNNMSDSSPIVIEQYKLIFFPVPKVADSIWLILLRRMMGSQTCKSFEINSFDGLVRLSDFSIEQATHKMNSPQYSRAIFLRDPKDRFLSTYLDQVLNYDASIEQSCCPEGESCLHKFQTVTDFATLIQTCNDKQWMPMSSWIDEKFIPKLNFVGHLENAEADARSLLERVGAWEPFGVSGWGKHGNESIFATKDKLTDLTASDTSDSWHLMSKLFTPNIESTLELYYEADYSIHEFGLPLIKIPFPIEISRIAAHIIMFDTVDNLKYDENSSIGSVLETNNEAETAPCPVDCNQTKNAELMDRGIFIGDLAARLFDEGFVLGFLWHWNF